MNDNCKVLIIYHSRLGSVQKMARLIARGVESVTGCSAEVRAVEDRTDSKAESEQQLDAFAGLEDLHNCDGLILGSPTRFGNMSATMKQFIDSTSSEWFAGTLSGKPAAVFTSSSSMHGGQESTLLSMLNPLLHHGMLICGIPYTEAALRNTSTGGTPYGASHVAGSNNDLAISEHEKILCMALGKRVAEIAFKLKR